MVDFTRRVYVLHFKPYWVKTFTLSPVMYVIFCTLPRILILYLRSFNFPSSLSNIWRLICTELIMFLISYQVKKIWSLYLFWFVCYILLNKQTPIIIKCDLFGIAIHFFFFFFWWCYMNYSNGNIVLYQNTTKCISCWLTFKKLEKYIT